MFRRTIILVGLLTPVTNAQNAPVIAPADAKDHIGRKVIVEMVVQSVRHVKDKKICFLNSEQNLLDNKNLAVVLTSQMIDQMQDKGVEDLNEYFVKKKIRVSGQVSLYDNRPQVKVRSVENLVILPASR